MIDHERQKWINAAGEYYELELGVTREQGAKIANELIKVKGDLDPLAAVAWDVHENPDPLVDPGAL